MLGRDIFVLKAVCLFLCLLYNQREVLTEIALPDTAADNLGKARDFFFESRKKVLDVHLDFFENDRNKPLILGKEAAQKMQRADILRARLRGKRMRFLKRLLSLRSEVAKIHNCYISTLVFKVPVA